LGEAFGLNVDATLFMKLIPKRRERLFTKNFTEMNSEAIATADFDEKNKIVELEWRDEPVNRIYHYEKATKTEWKKIVELGKIKGNGLGAYLNRVFKNSYDTPKRDYYELIVDEVPEE